MKKKIKKGFTLVELLVVMAILAILSTVSVVGYLGFTEKAKQSKLETEMVQVREVVRGMLLDGSDVLVGKTTFSMENGVVTVVVTVDGSTITDENFVAAFTDLKSLNDETVPNEFALSGTTALTYTTDGYTATWTFANDEIKVSKSKAA